MSPEILVALIYPKRFIAPAPLKVRLDGTMEILNPVPASQESKFALEY